MTLELEATRTPVEQRRVRGAVETEIGVLQRVLVHRPGRELSRLTPDNKDAMLFDELPWLDRARAEHDAFTVMLRDRGVEVLVLEELLADVLEHDAVREQLIAAAVDATQLERTVVAALTRWLDELAPATLAEVLIAGVTGTEFPLPRGSLLRAIGRPHAFVVAPLPNQMFTRDSSVWIGDRPYMSEMAHAARRREPLLLDAIYRHHAAFAAGGRPVDGIGNLEGGDVLVLAPGRILVGVGERTSVAAVERLAGDLLGDPDVELLVAALPSQRATMHLDTVLTMVDHATFTVYPEVVRSMEIVHVRRGRHGLSLRRQEDLSGALARALDVDAVRLLETGGDASCRQREQWDDANNVLALAPGVVAAYDRNVATNERLTAAGVTVLTVPGSELGRGRGGPRCLSCPLARGPVQEERVHDPDRL